MNKEIIVKAQLSYKKALSLYEKFPEVYAAMGQCLYLNQLNILGKINSKTDLISSLKAFENANKYKNYFAENSEKLEFLQNYIELLFLNFEIQKYTASNQENIVINLEESITIRERGFTTRKKFIK